MAHQRNLDDFLWGNGTNVLSELDLHLLNGWRQNTLVGYNSAVKKFRHYLQTEGVIDFTLPASPQDIYGFCFWAGRNEFGANGYEVMSSTLKKYLFGLQAWHLFHDVPYAYVVKNRVAVMLRASAQADAVLPSRPPKPAVMVKHVLALFNDLNHDDAKESAILDCAICAFWGLARLAELTYDISCGDTPWINSVWSGDVMCTNGSSRSFTLRVRGAKTAKAGIVQHILLNSQPNPLCPVRAVLRQLSTTSTGTDSQFGWNTPDGTRCNLTQTMVASRCIRVWEARGWHGISGHSFPVGGASLRAALGIPHEDIKTLGRWTSQCYRLYLREYASDDLEQTVAVLNAINPGGM